MKKITLFCLTFMLCVTVLTAQNNQVKKNPVGTWKFEAPYAPEGYTSGTIVVGMAESKYTTTMSFTGSEYKLTGEKVKAANDSVTFIIYLENQDIKVRLKLEDQTKMTGKAIYSEGEVPLALTRTADIR
jgi:hypothetical protein